MYEFFEGKLESISPQYIVINVNGVGYRIVTANPFRWQNELHQQVRCVVEMIVREDSMTLYGFYSSLEKDLFLKLNKVSGIGPKSALSILALDDHDGLIQAIESGDSKYLIKFPGVGKKTAQQMILDLKGELSAFSDQTDLFNDMVSTEENSIHNEVIEALEGLGYSKREVQRVEKALNNENFNNTQDGLSFAFKLLIK